MGRTLFARRLLLLTGLLGLLPATAYAQGEAVFAGTITDTTGGVLPGATVTAVLEATGNTFLAVTDAGGTFRLPVRVGVYRLTAELQGFTTFTRTAIEVLVGQTASVSIQMMPASVEESVTVRGEAPLIDTTTSGLRSNIDPRQMQELPLNGRNWIDLTMLAPGSRQNAVAETPTNSTGSNVNFQLNLDGQQVTNLVAVTFGQPRFSRDIIGEFEFGGRFDASQGRSSGVQVNAVTKSGTNVYAGSLSGYFRDDRFNAADLVAHRVLPYSDQQISTTFGGPIVKDKFHFFGGYEYEREPQTYVYTTPYARFNGSLTGARRQDMEVVRFDYQFAPQTRLSVRSNRYDNRIPYDPRYTGGSDRTPSSAIGTNRRSEQVFMNLLQAFGNRAVNEVKAGHNLFHWNQYSHVTNPNSLPGQTRGFGAPQVSFRGLTVGQTHAITPQDIGQEIWSFRDDLTISFQKRGRHDVKTGGEYLHDFTFETVCQNCMGLLDVQGGPIPSNIESLFPDLNDVSTWNLAPLSPIARTYQRNIATAASTVSRPSGSSGFTEYAPRHVMAAWVQDDWQMTSRLTLNLGLRYDAAVGAFVNWVEFLPFIHGSRANDLNNIAPRVGVAYQLTDATVLRGGFGKYFAEITSQPAIFTLRFVQQVSPLLQNDGRPDFASNPFNGPAPSYPQALLLQCSNAPDPLSRTCLRPSLQNFVADDLQVPYSYQSSIGFQHQIGTQMAVQADYTFSGVRAEFNTRNTNIAYNPATGANYPLIGANVDFSKRPFPAWGNTQMNRSDRRTNSHALVTALNKRMSNRWQASATYTFSGQWEFDQLPLNPGCQYPATISAAGTAVCNVPITLAADISENKWFLTGDQRHRATFNGIWDVGHGFQVSGLYIVGDNGKATPQAGVDVRQVGSSSGRLRPNGTLIQRNSLDIPAFHRMDMRIQQRFTATNRLKIDGILEVFNVFNHANYENSATGFVINESNARFGKPNVNTNLPYAPRMLQLGFRAQF